MFGVPNASFDRCGDKARILAVWALQGLGCSEGELALAFQRSVGNDIVSPNWTPTFSDNSIFRGPEAFSSSPLPLAPPSVVIPTRIVKQCAVVLIV